MNQIELNVVNIFDELFKVYSSIAQNKINKEIVLIVNNNTFNIYKYAYALKFGYSLPTNLNYMGYDFYISETVNNNEIIATEKIYAKA